MITKDLGTSSGSLADGESRLAGTAQVGHTPGPWHHESCGDWSNVSDADGFSVAEAMMEPDARLIAAAPDMLAALKGILRVCPSERRGMRLAEYDAARAAIAKAGSRS